MGVTAALVTMPFGSSRWPSIQIGTLAPISRAAGIPTDALQLNLHLAVRLGRPLYERLGDGRSAFGDWLFAPQAFDLPGADDRLVEEQVAAELAAALGEEPDA